MRRQRTDSVEATTEPFPVLQPSVPKERAQQDSRYKHGYPGANTAAPARRNSASQCSHYWIIEAAVGPMSNGVCNMCGEERLFTNCYTASDATPVAAANDRHETKHGMDPSMHRLYDPFLLPRSSYWKSVAVELAGMSNRQVI